MRYRRQRNGGLPAAVACEHGAESGVEIAQFRLRSLIPILLVEARSCVLLQTVDGGRVVKMPDGVRERPMLRDEEQQHTGKMQQGASVHHERFYPRRQAAGNGQARAVYSPG